ncbi:MAG: hypothetical protein EOM64_09865, partial [Erysipelotrichia bacterium]|nr:hypothetical protein [Erysipelotrichia bacterium]
HMKSGYTMKQYRDWFCFPVIDYYYKLGYTFDKGETYDDISVEFNQLYDKRFSEVSLMPGFREKIRESIKKGYQNIILSASEQDHLTRQCQYLKIDDFFQEIIGTSNLLAAGKTDRARRWMNQSDVTAEECFYIGDTVHDKETADVLGIKNYILVACGHQSLEVLKKASDSVAASLWEVVL